MKKIFSYVLLCCATAFSLLSCTAASRTRETDQAAEAAESRYGAEENEVSDPAQEESLENETESGSDSGEEIWSDAVEENSLEHSLKQTEFDDLVLIGDSRTLCLSSGGELEYQLVPDSSVFATWGGELTDESAKANAQAAADAGRKIAVFWYGINDVQGNPERDDAQKFRENYEEIINLYCERNPDSRIIILSILTTSEKEKDYYAGQEENIRLYNQELSALCAQKGYSYLDLTDLYTDDSCLAPGDNIHFAKEWYEEKFLPAVLNFLMGV